MATKQQPRRKAKRKAAAIAVKPARESSLQEGTPAQGGSFSLRGPLAATKSPSALEAATKPLAEEVSIRVKQEFRPAERGVAKEAAAKIEADDVIELEFADGTCTWMRADEYRERFASGPSRDAQDADLYVPTTIAVPSTGTATRGVTSWVVKSIKVLGVDAPKASALAVAQQVEKRKSLRRPGLGLFKCALDGDFALRPHDLARKAGEQPILVFLHGTLSSTWGSFGELWSKEREAELAQIRSAYGERVYGFEHPTLAVSPIENARELAQALPENCKVHLVSHSRGGLVGELLCRGQARVESLRSGKKSTDAEQGWSSAESFGADELALFDTEGRSGEKSELLALAQLLADKNISVERFVRVACPALGTTLASGRLDRWLSVFGTVASKALPHTPVSDVFEGLGEFVAAVVKERTKPEVLPGVEAMMPESPFVQLVNFPRKVVAGELFVIAGDLDPDALWARLLSWISDRFYGGDHDIVVNTASMYGGANRTGKKQAGFFRDAGVNHFNYFRNGDSAAALVGALTRGAHPALQDFEPRVVDIAREIATRDATPRPVVIFLPGIMGSALEVDGDGIWMDISDLAFGGFLKLAIGAKRKVRPVEPLARSYGELLRFLAATHRVVPFAYDWRLKPEVEADRLAEVLKNELDAAEKSNQPVRILAHSMGGLVTRTMIARHPKAWARLCAHDGGRFLMMGTPNGGSHSIPELLIGRSGTLKQLALLDLKNSVADLLGVVLRMPGVLAMLPHDPRDDYFAAPTWAAFAGHLDADWRQPDPGDLDEARAFRKVIDESPLDRDHVLYVAGRAPQTVCGIRVDGQQKNQAKRLVLEATNRGDGRVTWDSGIPSGIRTWYMDAVHGDLCSEEEHFAAIQDLLATGTTTRLSTDQPVQRGTGEIIALVEPSQPLYPDEPMLRAQVLGGSVRRRAPPSADVAKVNVRVLHADLAFSSYPVMVGHYTGDTIISAEKALDRSLGGQLSQRLALGLYPGPPLSNALFVNPELRKNNDAVPKGAIVVGLGMPGLLSSSQLADTLTRAIVEYAVAWTSQALPTYGQTGNQLGLSALLVGSGMGGVEVPDAVAACLRSVVQANEALAAASHAARIATLEFIELYRDRAYETIASFKKVEAGEPSLAGHFNFNRTMSKASGGRERLYYSEAGGWWHRIHIEGADREGSNRKDLKFSATTRKARGDQQKLTVQRQPIDDFIRQAIGSSAYNRGISRSLFELLLPNDFKDGSLSEDNVVLLLDAESARYPWELLEDPLSNRGQQGPFICNHGLLRQLIEPAENVPPSTSADVLVIGDPLSPFIELKGAQEEARVTARAFEMLGRYRVNHLDRPRGQDVLAALFDRAYRVVHLAGHGVYNYKADDKSEPMTGMVIGAGMFLSPDEIAQLRRVPELVFVNCCHLGRADADPALKNLHGSYNRIAANLAQAFIRKGARAVVAAGWAVGDAAATAFARHFYQLMLSGSRFGEATRSARSHIYDQFPSDNTWGAYQCYGDPDYRLLMDSGSGAGWISGTDSPLDQIRDIEVRLQTASDDGTLELMERLDKIESELDQPLKNGEVALALARAHWEAMNFKSAVDFHRLALQLDPQLMTLRDIEQFANQLARHAVDVFDRSPGQQGRAQARKLFEEAEQVLQWLQSMWKGTEGKTIERCSLEGSINKRRAMIAAEASELNALLGKMAEQYSEAAAQARKQKKESYYPELSVIAAKLARQWLSRRAKAGDFAQLRAELAEVTAAIALMSPPVPQLWLSAARVDCEVLAALIDGKFADGGPEALARRYRNHRSRASRREYGSVCDQIDFFARMADRAKRKELATGLQNLLKAMRQP
jgi:pimeloyl-ACP methyl ester carboxylesterase